MRNCSMHSIHPVFFSLFGRVGVVGFFWIFVVPNVFPQTSHIFSSTPKWVPNIFLEFSTCSSLCPYAFPNFVKLKPTKLSQYWDFIYIYGWSEYFSIGEFARILFLMIQDDHHKKKKKKKKKNWTLLKPSKVSQHWDFICFYVWSEHFCIMESPKTTIVIIKDDHPKKHKIGVHTTN